MKTTNGKLLFENIDQPAYKDYNTNRKKENLSSQVVLIQTVNS